MPRIQFSDVTPPERRSIRDIPIPKGGKRKVPLTIKPEMSDVTEKKKEVDYYPKEQQFSEPEIFRPQKSKKKPWLYGAIAFVVVIIFIISMMTVFASATIAVTPKSQDIAVNTKINASVEAGDGLVRYEVVKLSKTDTATVPATGEASVELKASGKITIYNNFSTDPQRLIVRTRFENPDGLIYRIPESVVVPGKTVKNGVSTPGSIETTIFADEAGDKYNIKKSDFTIPGFKSDANRFKNIYARGTTDITGGFVGNQKTVVPADKQTALQTVDTETDANLTKELGTKVPEGLVMLPGGIQFQSVEIPDTESGSSVVIGKEVTAYAVMLNSNDLSKVITDTYVSKLPDWNGINTTIKDFSGLNMTSLLNNLEATSGPISLQINGNTKVWANIDTNLISQKLLGAPKKDAANLLNEFSGIESVTSTLRPLWKQTFPKDSSRIHVQVTLN